MRVMQVSAAMTHSSVRIVGIQQLELVRRTGTLPQSRARDDEAARARNCKMKLLPDMQHATALLSHHTQSCLQWSQKHPKNIVKTVCTMVGMRSGKSVIWP